MAGLRLSLFATRKISCFPRHDATWMEKVEYDKGTKHREAVQSVLIHFVGGDRALEAVGVFGETETDSHLASVSLKLCRKCNLHSILI